MNMSGRSRWIGLVVLIATFIVGTLAGAATVRVVSAREPARVGADGDSASHGHLLDRLDLTPQQRQQAEAILERRRAQMDAFWKQRGPELRAIVDSTRAEIRELLTPEQRMKEDSLRAERRREYERHDHDRRGDGGRRF